MKFALAVLLLTCHGQNGNVLRRNHTTWNEDGASLKEIMEKTVEALDNSAATEIVTIESEYSRTSNTVESDNVDTIHMDSTSKALRKKPSSLYEDNKNSIPRKRDSDTGLDETDLNFDDKSDRDLVKPGKLPSQQMFLDFNSNEDDVVKPPPVPKQLPHNDHLWPKPREFGETSSKPKDLFEPVNVLYYFDFGGKSLRRKYESPKTKICSRTHRKFARQQEKAGCQNAVDIVYTACLNYRKCIKLGSKDARNCMDLVCSNLKKLDKKDECYNRLFPCKL
ncbi:unnamed protein product [Cylicocyclus nassatus]|uniref:Uncharacterized protein n=1 Tax=Cylicocyclus nassatus TaxID=53992 RepID=A0AA36H947_CYLNA|nr:unnamed protein product [Cylicocyclus nassatus]